MQLECKMSQPFGANAITTYVAGGLKGHTGVDSGCGFGTPIHAVWGNEYVYKVLTKESPANDGSGFTGIFTIINDERGCFEFLYGHGNPAPSLLGTTLSKGQVIGTEANNGEVYSGGVRITLEMQQNGDTRGAHRHDQKRPLRRDVALQPNTQYLTALGGGFTNYNGFFYAIPDFNNGYAGCVDWVTQTVNRRKELFKTLMFAARDYQIECGLNDFKGVTDPKKIRIGAKTLQKITEDII